MNKRQAQFVYKGADISYPNVEFKKHHLFGDISVAGTPIETHIFVRDEGSHCEIQFYKRKHEGDPTIYRSKAKDRKPNTILCGVTRQAIVDAINKYFKTHVLDEVIIVPFFQ